MEATTLSEGRGTTRPFSLIGAPFLSWKFARALRERHAAQPSADGVLYREAYFTPTSSKHALAQCAETDSRASHGRDKLSAIRDSD